MKGGGDNVRLGVVDGYEETQQRNRDVSSMAVTAQRNLWKPKLNQIPTRAGGGGKTFHP